MVEDPTLKVAFSVCISIKTAVKTFREYLT